MPSLAPAMACITTTLAGSAGLATYQDGYGTSSLWSSPSGLAVDSTAGRLYVVDTNSHRLRVLSLADGSTFSLSGTGSTTPFIDGTGLVATFSSPLGIAVDSTGYIYVADTGAARTCAPRTCCALFHPSWLMLGTHCSVGVAEAAVTRRRNL